MGNYLPSLLRRALGARPAAAAALACLAFAPGAARAMQPQLWGFVPTCEILSTAGVTPVAVAPVIESKATVILGGTPSKLELLRAEHAGIPSPAAGPSVHMFSQMGCPPQIAAATQALVPTKPPATTASSFAPGARLDLTLPRVAVPDNGRPDVFGSVALVVGQTPLDHRWKSVRGSGVSGKAGPWSKLVRSQRGQSRVAQIAAVNSWVNERITFVDDIKAVGVSDQWASAAQSLKRGRGDCEDYAIAKMQILGSLGMDTSDMYLVIARDLVRQADHAVLVVRTDGQLLVLDNGTDRIVDARAKQDYRPIMSYSGNRSWLHGYPVEPRQSTGPIQTASLR